MTKKILSWNVNGIRALMRKDALRPLLEEEQPDILCLQETKISSEADLPQEVKECGYKLYLSYSIEKKGYSGVLTLTKEEPIAVRQGMGIEKFDKEGRIIETEFENFTLFNVYFPNGKASEERLKYKMEFYEAFAKHVEKRKAEGKNIIVCGDVNTAHKEIDLARPKDNEKISGFLPQEREWIDSFLELGYLDTFREYNQNSDEYTWWSVRSGARSRNVGWRIDYFYINSELKENLKDAFILQKVLGSDHCPLGILLKD
jgi:exodeoxyribonuclease-3